ncbi:MAG: LD-carboxypeptidase [Lachnospiraceae bacterium]|nr:LD-carboxypeptidase [Lachnospiraceae bacterium]
MKKLIIPSKLNEGDTVAFISISGGRAGDADMLPRYRLGKRRFEKIFHVNVIETPNALCGSEYLYEHPEKRAEDLMWALENDSVKGIICNQGGDDSYRVLPYIDPQVIHDHPKVFMGFSDIATWMAVFAYAGVRAYYGPTVLTPIAQPGKLDEYTENAIRRALFSDEVIGEIKPAEKHTPIDWNTTYTIREGMKEVQYERFPDDDRIEDPNDPIPWTPGTGYKVLQGSGKVRGQVIAVCGGPLWQIMGTKYFPGPDIWEDTVIAMEHCSIYGSKLAGLHELRAFAAAGVFDKAKAVITGPLDDDSEETILKVMCKEINRPDIVILENADFVHRTPMTVLPTGALTEIDCDAPRIEILESGVV